MASTEQVMMVIFFGDGNGGNQLRSLVTIYLLPLRFKILDNDFIGVKERGALFWTGNFFVFSYDGFV